MANNGGQDIDTIAAVATAPGQAGIGVIRVSGPAARAIAEAITGRDVQPRRVLYRSFRDSGGEALDSGLLLYFAGPKSFTGEDVVEFQGHGGPVVLQMLLDEVLEVQQELIGLDHPDAFFTQMVKASAELSADHDGAMERASFLLSRMTDILGADHVLTKMMRNAIAEYE